MKQVVDRQLCVQVRAGLVQIYPSLSILSRSQQHTKRPNCGTMDTVNTTLGPISRSEQNNLYSRETVRKMGCFWIQSHVTLTLLNLPAVFVVDKLTKVRSSEKDKSENPSRFHHFKQKWHKYHTLGDTNEAWTTLLERDRLPCCLIHTAVFEPVFD